jgi:hypothetical protein
VSVDVPNPREHVYDFLDLMANNERFTDHFMRDWQYSPAKLRMSPSWRRQTSPRSAGAA